MHDLSSERLTGNLDLSHAVSPNKSKLPGLVKRLVLRHGAHVALGTDLFPTNSAALAASIEILDIESTNEITFSEKSNELDGLIRIVEAD